MWTTWAIGWTSRAGGWMRASASCKTFRKPCFRSSIARACRMKECHRWRAGSSLSRTHTGHTSGHAGPSKGRSGLAERFRPR